MGPHVTSGRTKITKLKTGKQHKLDKTERSAKLKSASGANKLSPGVRCGEKDLAANRCSSRNKRGAPVEGAAVATGIVGAVAVVGVAEPNAAAHTNMAPALTEPLSPTEKLSGSTAKAAPTTRSSQKNKAETSASSSAATGGVGSSTTTTSTSSSNNNKEKRNRNSSTPIPSTSTRVTRSKDAHQRSGDQVVEQSASVTAAAEPVNSNEVAASTEPEDRPKNDEQMGLTAALNNNNNNETQTPDSKATTLPSASQSQSESDREPIAVSSDCKPSSTEQLLADLTNDFEEAITAEICLRKQLREGNLSKESSSTAAAASGVKSVPAAPAETKRKGGSTPNALKESERAKESGVAAAVVEPEPQHMESTADSTLFDELSTHLDNTGADAKKSASPETISTRSELDDINREDDGKLERVGAAAASSSTETAEEPMAVDETGESVSLSQKRDTPSSSSRLHIIAVEELPPISTDSTMTASEVEDNLEERLSQLDGTAIASPNVDDVHRITPLGGGGLVTTTPPRTPSRSHQQQIQQLQQQLQQTPPTPLSQQVHHQQQQQLAPHTFTPQSSSSSVNTLSSGQLPPAFMKESAAGELEDQDIEEVLKALKGFDGSAGADTLCDLNVLFNEVYTTLNYEEISSQPASTTTKPNPLKDMHSEIQRSHQSMQRKIEFLLRRLRKLQARYMSKHTSEEIAGLFEWTARVVSGKGVGSRDETTAALLNDPSTSSLNVIAARPPAVNWAEERKNPVPSSQMLAVLRRLEHASNSQQLSMTANSGNQATTTTTTSHGQVRKSKKSLQDAQAPSTSGLMTAAGERKSETIVATLDVNVVDEMTQVAGLLQSEMREVQNAIDSDATESSSGGESADEMVTYNNQIQQPLSIAKRAAWRYSRDRAAIASRWSWLLSQIADLEIKIRQHSELHQEIVRTKGIVSCGMEEQFASEAGTTTNSSVNGYKGDLCGALNPMMKGGSEGEVAGLPGSCRTRGYVAAQFRKRKLFQTANIHTFSKKAARPSTIKCGCQWPLHPCALCTGRPDPTAPRDPPDTMMMADRVALLDPGYHPVLSFPEDVNNVLHFEGIARQSDWQQRVMRCQVRSIAKSVWKAEREAAAAAGHHSSKKYGDPTTKRRYIKKKDRLAMEEKNAALHQTTNGAGGTANAPASSTAAAAASTSIASSAAASAAALMSSSSTSDAGNGTGNLSTSTTPLVANKSAKHPKKPHYHLVADGVLLEPPLSPVATNNSSHSQQSSHSSNSNYIHQTSDYPPQNYDPYNPNPTHSSLISSSSSNSNGGGIGGGGHKNNKYRKSSSSTTAANAFYHSNSHHYHYNNNNNSQYLNTNGNSNSEFNFLHTNDNWDGGYVARSRTSSPTHGSSSSYHKYERSKNRTSYDIDNIVIPYSVAAATRVEILPYKEIPTPKWRVIEDEKATTNPSNNSSEITEPVDDDQLKNNVDAADASMKADCGDSLKSDKIKTADTSIKDTKKLEAPALSDDKQEITKNHTSDITKEQLQINNLKNSPEKKNNILPANTITPKVQATTASSSGSSPDKKLANIKVNEAIAEPECKKLKIDAACDNKKQPLSVESSGGVVSVECKDFPEKQEKKDTFAEPMDITEEEDDEGTAEEDISDDAMMQRHERALTEERRKFQTFLKFPWSTRSRANRRIDSRAESSGANTPDPASPAPQTPSVGGGDQESIPSPLAPSTPLNPLDSISEAGENVTVNSILGGSTNCVNKRLERRRTTSTKKEREPERRSSTPDPRELVPPYEPLNFPLSEEAFQNLQSAMPSGYYCPDDFKFTEDCNSLNSNKYTRSRWRGDGITKRSIIPAPNTSGTIKIASNCDFNRRQKVNNTTRQKGGGASSRPRKVNNGNVLNNTEPPVFDDDEGDNEDEPDEGDYDYPKHHLAPDDDLFDNTAASIANDLDDDEYGAYVGGRRRMLLGDSEGESSETEPFQDDDPNDPEWKGESEDRSERLRKSLR